MREQTASWRKKEKRTGEKKKRQAEVKKVQFRLFFPSFPSPPPQALFSRSSCSGFGKRGRESRRLRPLLASAGVHSQGGRKKKKKGFAKNCEMWERQACCGGLPFFHPLFLLLLPATLGQIEGGVGGVSHNSRLSSSFLRGVQRGMGEGGRLCDIWGGGEGRKKEERRRGQKNCRSVFAVSSFSRRTSNGSADWELERQKEVNPWRI